MRTSTFSCGLPSRDFAICVINSLKTCSNAVPKTSSLQQRLKSCRPTVFLCYLRGRFCSCHSASRTSPKGLKQLSPPAFAVLLLTFAEAPRDEADNALLELVYPLLLTHLKNIRLPEGDAVLTYTPPNIIHATFAFIDKLFQLSQQQRTLEIFQLLVNSGNIPSEAVQTIPGLEGFEAIVRSSLVRASTHWNWRPLAERFLSPLLEPKTPPGRHIITLTKDTLYACLNEPSVADLVACRSLICQIHPYSPVPHGIIREYYDAAQSAGAPEEAHAMYSFTRSEEVAKTHWYPCPRADALAWLLRYLLEGNSHNAQDLAREILESSNLILPVEFRPHIVEQLAERGHAGLARGLWSKYAFGKDRQSFIQNPSLFVRMVSLFNHLVQRDDRLLEKRQQDRDEGSVEVDGGAETAVRERRNDCKEFLDFVMSEFALAHSPLHQCNHQVITSQARAYFIVGDFVRGFETIKVLIDRKEMPDIYDVNVTLTIMAQHDPRTAAQIVQRMIDKGLQPDHITFGTVMHHALAHGDMELVDEMVQRVRELQNTHLSYKSIVSLIRGSIAFDAGLVPTHSAQLSKLHSAFDIVKSIGRSSIVYSPHLGKFLVYSCLRASDPTMAFKFWELLIKDRAAQDDMAHVAMRRVIVRALDEHRTKKWVKEMHARAMIAQLTAGETFAKNKDIR
ncbi:Golgi reassembly stacking protein 2 [Mycena venus]|uniref:Golgi reassembly stacking protein 2 n=1 Tax=Mycena venus TaxID=2733690 RepID=A0A8H6YUB8_9AGAR|nr:Golgi reassembly stacking protein 2 [Mycena venus]